MDFIDNDDAPKILLKQLKHNLKNKLLDNFIEVEIEYTKDFYVGIYKVKCAKYNFINKNYDIKDFVYGNAEVFFINNDAIKILDSLRTIFKNDKDYFYFLNHREKLNEFELEILDKLYFAESIVYFCVNNVMECASCLDLETLNFGLLSFYEKNTFKRYKVKEIKRASILSEIAHEYVDPSSANKYHVDVPTVLFIDPIDFAYNCNGEEYFEVLKAYKETLKNIHKIFNKYFNDNLNAEILKETYEDIDASVIDNVGITEYDKNNFRFSLISHGENSYFTDGYGLDGFGCITDGILTYYNIKKSINNSISEENENNG